MDQLTLNCWVRSEDPTLVFQVRISNTDTVDDLQKAIKNAMPVTFRHVDAKALALYKPKDPVSIPYEKLRKLILSKHGELLYRFYRLSDFIPEPLPKYDIHIIVDVPSEFICYLRGANLSYSFPLAIHPGGTIDHLICCIKDALPSLRSVANHRIRLYRISGDENELRECLGKTGDGELLQGHTLPPNFLGVPVLDPLRIVIEVSTSPTPTISPTSSLTSNISAHSSSIGEYPPAVARKRNHDGIVSDEQRRKGHKTDSSIVDDGPCYVKFGAARFKRLLYDGSSTDYMLHFYEQFWGVPLPQEHISLKGLSHDLNDEENNEENGRKDDGDLLPAIPPPIIDSDWRQLLIRAEYLRIYKWVEDMYEEGRGRLDRPPAIVVTGQPGIGKSYWAYYVLRRRLGEKSVSLWLQGPTFYLFCSEGVLVVPATFTFNKFSTHPHIWTIIDSSQSPSGIPNALNTFLPGVFPIYLTSPQPKRWSRLGKSLGQSWMPHEVIMNPWTRAEIEYAAKNLSSNKGIHDVLQRYDRLGPTARFCLEMTPDQVATYITDRDKSIANTSLDRFREHFSNGVEMSYDTFSHKICLIRRTRGSRLGYGDFTTELISAAVEQKVVQRLEEFSQDQLLDLWTNFWRVDNTRGMTGSIFKAFVHRHFRKHIHLDAMPMVRSNRANSHWHASFSTKLPDAATDHAVVHQDFSLRIVGSTFVYYDATTKLHIQ